MTEFSELSRVLLATYSRDRVEKMVTQESPFRKFLRNMEDDEPEVCRFEELERGVGYPRGPH